MLIFICLTYHFVVRELISPSITVIPDKSKEMLKNPVGKYWKSSLSVEQLNNYDDKLKSTMLEEKLFLKPSLSLSGLATHLKMPNHHLTQVLSRQAHQTFHQYINNLRVAYACELLTDSTKEASLETIAEKSGFNSQPSFNRQFKAIIGCSPSEYRNQQRSQLT
ncbi:helix-turn-helix domain-containing protein [Pedobacter polaris]|nr:helix-turn-helix domain-containing protein [Pedobacter polaris]